MIKFCECGFRFVRPSVINKHMGNTKYEHYIVRGAHAVYVCTRCYTLTWVFANGEAWITREPKIATGADIPSVKEVCEYMKTYMESATMAGLIDPGVEDSEIEMCWSV